jgi:nicotinate-nucleotide adenylyltransferase
MKIALFGGSFDPPHRGHVALARLAVNRLHLDRILVAPVGRQPLKHEATTASFDDRMAMAQLAFGGEPLTEVSGADAPRSDGRPNYTIDAVLQLKRTLGEHDTLFCLMGADSWLTIGKWYRAPELLMACDFIVGARPGFDLDQIPRALPAGIRAASEQSRLPGCLLSQLSDSSGRRTRLYLLPDLAEDVSATEVRAALSHHEQTPASAKAVLSPEVTNYIHAHRLYGVDTWPNALL